MSICETCGCETDLLFSVKLENSDHNKIICYDCLITSINDKELEYCNEPCEYCHARPTYPVIYDGENGSRLSLLCSDCDQSEIDSIREENV